MDAPIFDKTPKSNVCFPLLTVIIFSTAMYASNNNIYACFLTLFTRLPTTDKSVVPELTPNINTVSIYTFIILC
jgi:hypothetical protein